MLVLLALAVLITYLWSLPKPWHPDTRTAAELARRIIDRGGVSAVHIYSSMVTVHLASDEPADLASVIGGLYTYYLPGVEIPSDEELIAMVE